MKGSGSDIIWSAIPEFEYEFGKPRNPYSIWPITEPKTQNEAGVLATGR